MLLEIFIPCLIISFGEATAHVSLNVVTNGSLTARKTSEMTVQGYYSKAKLDRRLLF